MHAAPAIESAPASSVQTQQTTKFLWLQRPGKRFPWLRDKLFDLFAVDLRSLALLRITIGSIVLLDLISRVPQLKVFYSDDGIVPRGVVYDSQPRSWYASLHFLSGRFEVEALMFLISGVFAVMLILGYRTRLASFLSWLLLTSLHARNPYVVHGGDSLLRMLAFWGMFVPWGARYSFESALNTATESLPKRLLSIGTVALILQMPIVYFFTGLLKNGREWRHDFTAISYVLKAPDFALPFGSWLASFPAFLKVATFCTLLLEIGGAFLLLSPFFTKVTRLVAIAGFLALQIGFVFTMKLGLFPVVSTVALLPFVPSSCWDRWYARTQIVKKRSPLIYYDGDCGFCYKLARLIKGFCALPQARVLPAQSNPPIHEEMRFHNSWIVVGEEGVHHRRFAALVYLIGLSPIIWPAASVLRWSPIKSLGDAAYDLVASNRSSLARALDWLKPRALSAKQPLILSLLCALCLAYVVIDNLGSVSRSPIRIPAKLGFVGQLLRIHQNWRMFAPTPPRASRWNVVDGQLQDGRTVTLFDGNPLSPTNPDNQAFVLNGYNWRTYWSWVRLEEEKDLRPYAARYFCSVWNKTHGEQELLSAVTLHKTEKPIQLNGPEQKPQETTLLEFNCPQPTPIDPALIKP